MPSSPEINFEFDGIGHAILDKRLIVPVYQRSYAWKNQNVLDLFQDIGGAIADNKENEYFLGSIVAKDNDRNLEVVDGQQRLATVSILLGAIRDYFYETGDTERAKDIEGFLLTRDRRTQEIQPKLTLNEIDNDFFGKRILARPDNPDRVHLRQHEPTKESHRLIANTADLAAKRVKQIADETPNATNRLLDWVDYIEKRVRIIWLTVPDDSNAFMIFETLNDRGLQLAISDLLKNYLFGNAQDRLEEVRQRWVAMTGSLETISNEDKDEITVTYIRHLWSSMYGLTREKELYKQIKSSITGKQRVVDFADELSKNSRLYAAIQDSQHDFWVNYGTTTRDHIRTLNYLRVEQNRPLLLAILRSFEPNEIRKSLYLLVSWAVRFLIVGGGGGTLEDAYSKYSKEITDGKITNVNDLINAMSGIVPTDSAFEGQFAITTISKNYLARYYLQALERTFNGEDQPEKIVNYNEAEVNLEHILPENPSNDWKHIESEIAKAYYKRIGNMVLLQGRRNSSIGNSGFEAKKSAFKDSEIALTSSVANYSAWGTQEIEKRQKELADLAIKTWPLKI
jgi:uncharacterized protein with ParB-like and HNH nuclease domain